MLVYLKLYIVFQKIIKNGKIKVFNTLNDYKLRQVIEDETHDIRTILYAKAFADFDDIDSDGEV